MAAKDQWKMWLLHGLRFHRDILEIPIAAVKARRRLAPQELHNLHCFSEARHPPFAAVAEDVFVGAQMAAAKTDAHHRAPAAHDIEGRIGFSELHRIA